MFWVGMVFLSCLLAFLVNLSTFLVIGRTSPVSYQVMGAIGTNAVPGAEAQPPQRHQIQAHDPPLVEETVEFRTCQ